MVVMSHVIINVLRTNLYTKDITWLILQGFKRTLECLCRQKKKKETNVHWLSL